MAVWFGTNLSLQPGLDALFLLLSVSQPHRPPFRVPNVPLFFLDHILCTCYLLCMQCSSTSSYSFEDYYPTLSRIMSYCFFRFHLTCHFPQEAISTSDLDQVPWIHSSRFSFLYFKTLCNNIHIIWIIRFFFLLLLNVNSSFRKHIYFVFHYMPSLEYNAFNIAEVQY